MDPLTFRFPASQPTLRRSHVGVVGSGFEADDNTLEVHWATGSRTLGPAPKARIAEQLLDLLAEIG